MTPIARHLNRFLPHSMARTALGLTYAVMLVTIATLAGYRGSGHFVYLDVLTDRTKLGEFSR